MRTPSWIVRLASLAALLAPAAARAVTVEKGIEAEAIAPRGIRVVVTPRPGENWSALARRVTGRFANAGLLAGDRPGVGPEAGARVEIPFDLLTPALKRETVAALLPLDRCEGSSWIHQPAARFPPDASRAALARWFATGAAGAASIEHALGGTGVGAGGRLVLPCVAVAPWLASARGCCTSLSVAEEEDRAEAAAADASGLDLLLAAAPVPASRPGASAALPVDLLPAGPPAPGPRPAAPAVAAAAAADLTYGRDDKGEYAAYRLKAGEAIYSAVIARFTGRVHAREVNELVPVIAERSGVRSFATLPIGFEVKLPLEYVATEYLPRSDPKRREYERKSAEVSRIRNDEVAADLAGVSVILDAGHGGRDRGAIAEEVWESDYVYDIFCRIKARLEKTTRARVYPLLSNRRLGYRPRDRRRLSPEPDAYVQTTPPYRLDDPIVGVNLRWYLTNSLYRKLVRNGADPRRIVFTSIHADSLHPSVRGAMVYVPAEEFTGGRHGRRGPEYDARREVKEEPSFSFKDAERREAEGLSRDLAGQMLAAFASRGLPVHEDQPVRGAVLRNGREWLPAVLRSNRVPARILLEVCNLNHAEDNRLLESPAFRQGVADAYVEALLGYYGSDRRAAVAERR